MSKFTFAHLIGRKAKATEEDDEKVRKAEEDERDEEAEGDDPDVEDHDDEKEGRKAKKAKSKKAEDEDEDPDAEDEDENVKKGRRAEQKRCAQIFGSKAAAGRPDMAAHLAFNTSLSASEAISTLKALSSNLEPQNNRRSLDARMREEEQVRLGQDTDVAPKGSAEAVAQRMTSLYNRHKGGK
ncbi:hypothetical protein CHI95_00085 [Providencia rettgeri]|uniref:Uncharacterized protein n=1 Tax=Providencia rettgeri TaxID=587 RepID=A0A264VY70_PRORE|nr:hypothetical protein [Providencia rettgeri]OZS76270.1 hypothetical protein CHI95_00085 [Providencia rettgeri]